MSQFSRSEVKIMTSARDMGMVDGGLADSGKAGRGIAFPPKPAELPCSVRENATPKRRDQ
jgi:hypothetical protein